MAPNMFAFQVWGEMGASLQLEFLEGHLFRILCERTLFECSEGHIALCLEGHFSEYDN